MESEKEDLEDEKNKLEYKLKGYERINFEDVLRKASLLDKIKTSMTALKNRINESYEDIEKEEESSEKFSIKELLEEVMNKK